MQTKTINKLEDLNGYEWEERGKNFIIEDFKLELKNSISLNGDIQTRKIMYISERNLEELEFYGLKVILNEKPKLTLEDKEFLEKEIYVAREQDGKLYLYFGKPRISKCGTYWDVYSETLFAQIDGDRFPFITWESGKAWSKAELMELEVID